MRSDLVSQGKLRPRTHPRSPSTARGPLPPRALQTRPWSTLGLPPRSLGHHGRGNRWALTPFSAQGARFRNKSVLLEATWLCCFPHLRYRNLWICVGRSEIILGSKFSPSPSPACGETEAQESNKSIVTRTSCGCLRPHPQKVPVSVVNAPRGSRLSTASALPPPRPSLSTLLRPQQHSTF